MHGLNAAAFLWCDNAPCRRSRAFDCYRRGIIQYRVRQETRPRRRIKGPTRVNALVQRSNPGQFAFGPKADAPTYFQSSNSGRFCCWPLSRPPRACIQYLSARPARWREQAQTCAGCRACAANVFMPPVVKCMHAWPVRSDMLAVGDVCIKSCLLC